jgi:predicted Zn-dependent protease
MMLIASGCATNPVTGKSELTLVGEATEISIGREQYLPAQQSQGGQYLVDPQLTQYVNEVGMRLAAVSDRKLPYEFVVINDSTPNAWALPGGKIALNRGLLVSLESEAELAAVLGHEIVHAAARHGAKSMERSMLLQGALVLTAIGAGDSEYSNHILGGAQLGAQLLSQRYGRQAELDADYYGMAYMARAGYDPAAAISLQEKFVALKEGRSTSWLEGLFASHPPSEDRVARNRETSEALKAGSSRDWDSGTNRFRQHLAYLSSKQPAYQAFDQARALIAKKETDVALSRVNRAISIEPKEPRFLGLKADIHLRSKKYDWAINNYSRALDLDDDYFEYYLGRGLANARLGNRVNAREDLERSNQLLPTALATNELGNLSLQAGDRATAKDYYLQVAQSSGPLARSARSSFIRLDLKDNPAEYFAVRLINQEGHLYVAVQNQSSIPVRSMTVAVAATINGETRQTRVKSGPLEQDAQTGLSTGWRISATDQVTASRAVVVSVSP